MSNMANRPLCLRRAGKFPIDLIYACPIQYVVLIQWR